MERLCTLLISACFLCQAALGGDITLKNGDRLSGKIVEETADSVVIETAYAGRVKIVRSHIERITPDGEKTAVTGDKAPETPAAASTSPAPAPARRSSVARAAERVFRGWDGNAQLGFSYTAGNANNITLTTGLRAVRVAPNGGLTVYFRSLRNDSHTAGITTQNAFWGGARYDRNLSKKVFGFLSYDFERDKPRMLRFRSVPGGGLGHRTIRNERTELELLAGLAWNRTWQTNGGSNTGEGLAGLTYKQKLNSRLRLHNTFTYFQNVTDASEYRLILDSTVTIDITARIGVFLGLGDRFNNDPIGTAKKNDFLLTTGFKWNFGKKK